MIGRDDGGTAFPVVSTRLDREAGTWFPNVTSSGGMSLRDHFAGLLMAAMFDGFAKMNMRNDQTARVCAREAYAVADAMIAERKGLTC